MREMNAPRHEAPKKLQRKSARSEGRIRALTVAIALGGGRSSVGGRKTAEHNMVGTPTDLIDLGQLRSQDQVGLRRAFVGCAREADQLSRAAASVEDAANA